MPSGNRAAEIDAVTVDAFGTLLDLEDPTDRLLQALRERNVDRPRDQVADAFRAEASYYRPRSLAGRAPADLERLREDCVRVFLRHLEAELDPRGFVSSFVGAIVFHPAPGALAALDRLRAGGLVLACVANWDVSLHDHLDRLGIAGRFDAVVTSAEAGAAKPDPAIFALALGRLDVPPARALHIGDEDADRAGALAAGIAFEPVPLATLPERLNL